MNDHRTRPPWVGDEVLDEAAGRVGVITDVERGERYLLRPRSGPGCWYAADPQRLVLICPREKSTFP